MGKVGRFVTDPKAGAYCQVKLESGEKILVSHDRGGFAGGSVTIQEVRWWGLVPGETLLQCDLERDDGRRMLASLTRGVSPSSARATPLGAFVDYVKDSRSLVEVQMKCASLVASGPHPAA